MQRSLDRISRNWTEWGRKDPMFAALVDEEKRGNRWSADAFFASGVEEVGAMLERVATLGLDVARGAALDFGCGVGRLTQALADQFTEAVGVDIAPTMIEHACEHNRHSERCRYVVNAEPDLRLFADASFDFVYSNIVLQHLPPDLSTGYVREFVRVLRPGAVAVFMCPARPIITPAFRDRVIGDAKEAVRNVANAVLGRRGELPFPRMEMHFVPQERMEATMRAAGGRVAQARVVNWGGGGIMEVMEYTVVHL